jgi:multidrug resistance efflux pump
MRGHDVTRTNRPEEEEHTMSTETREQPGTHAVDPAAPTAEIPVQRQPARDQQVYGTPTAPPKRSRVGDFLRALRTLVVVTILVVAAVAGGLYLARDRLAGQVYVKLSDVVLTAEPIPVGTTTAGVVKEVAVSPQTEVSEGGVLARITVTDPEGDTDTEVLRSPIDGVVSEIEVPSGGVATPGQPVVTLYDPARLTFQAEASVEELRKLRLGMTATVDAEGLGAPIDVSLDRVVPRVGTDQGDGGFIVVFVPAGDLTKVGSLVPGLPFTATVDSRTAAGGRPAVTSAK